MESSFAERLRQFRQHTGLSQSDFAGRAGIKQVTVSQAEAGRSNPNFDTLAALTTAFAELNPDWLLTGVGPMVRDGKNLTPAPRPTNSPPGPALVQESDYIKELKARAERAEAAADTWRDLYLGRYTLKEAEAAGKLTSGNHAAASAAQPIGFGQKAAATVTPLTDARLFVVDGNVYFAADAQDQPVRVNVTPIAAQEQERMTA